jgi:ATPase subunit of ABC transporter with duplicated ATPase domains
MKEKCKIGVVGPCAAGKSTLIASLKKHGYDVRHIAQEHSYVPSMWRRITNPDILIFLDVSYELSTYRRKLDWTEAEYAEQHYRLRDARQHADLYVDTNDLSADQVLKRVLAFLEIGNLP